MAEWMHFSEIRWSDGAPISALCSVVAIYFLYAMLVCGVLCMTDETGTEGGVSVCAKVRPAYRGERVWLDQSSRWT